MTSLRNANLSTDLPSQGSANVGVYRWPMKNLMCRIRDWRRERRIRFLTKCAVQWYVAGRHDLARRYAEFRADEIMARSPEQVARMERRMGLR